MQRVINILKEINDQIDYEMQKDLITSGTFSSFDILQCISLIEDEFNIEIPAAEIINENFESAESILNMIKRVNQ